MAIKVKKPSSPEFLSRYIVITLLAIILVVVIIAMFIPSTVNAETDWIGMTLVPISTEGAAAQGIPLAVGGLVVSDVEGIARRAGIQNGDVLLCINNKPVQDLKGLSIITGTTDITKGGARLDIIRRGARIPIYVQSPGLALGLTPAPAVNNEAAFGISRQWLGVEVETFTSGAGRPFGIPVGVRGALIEGVSVGSRAQRAGLVARDVIVSINGLKINSTLELWSTLGGLTTADRVEFGIYRQGRLVSVELPAPSATPVGFFPVWGGAAGARNTGTLICPSCQTKISGGQGVPSFSVLCPACGTAMVRAQ